MIGQIPAHLPADGALNADDKDALARSPLFAGCTEQQRELVLPFAHATHAALGGILLQPGEPNAHVYVLTEGQLGVFLDAHLEKMVARITPTEIVGEHALIGPDGGTVYVSAQWPARLVAIDAGKLRAVMEQVPRIALNALDILSARLRASNLRHDPADGGASLDFMAHHDALTGLYNKRWMSASYAATIARCARERESLSLVVLDVDHFHRMNEALGRAAADAILRQLADLIRNLLPSLDNLVRVSGDRFAFLWAAPLADTLAVCERLRAQVANRQFALRGGISTQTTVSIGVAQAMADLDATMEKALASLARAKERGRNTVEPLLG